MDTSENKTLKPTPFTPSAKSEVFVFAGNGPYKNTSAALSRIDLSVVKGKRVLLKPNAGRVARAGSGIVTDPMVVAAAIDAFNAAGAEVAIGESPITGVKVFEAFEASGIKKIADERRCPLIDLDKRACVNVTLPGGLAIKTLKVCPEIFEYDVIVSIPVMKMHMHTGATLSIKNMKGCLWRRSKVELHMLQPVPGMEDRPLDIAISDMATILRPHLAIIDGTVGLEGMGPSAGNKKELDIVIAGTDPFAADAIACRIMGFSAEEVPHLRMGGDRGCGTIAVDNIDVWPGNWESYISPFAHPPRDLSIEFPNVKVLDKNSCSACQSTVLLFLKRYGAKIFDYYPESHEIVMAIGKGHEDVPLHTLCIGNCTARHRKKGTYVPGCPPVGSEIFKAISGTVPDDLPPDTD